jgi:hypothetical protein
LVVMTKREHRMIHMNAYRRWYLCQQQLLRLQEALRANGIEVPA